MPVLADIGRAARLAPHHEDLGIVAHADIVGMDEDLAEAAGEGLVARHVELLVAEEDDAMLVQGIADLSHGAVVEIQARVDAGDPGAAGAGEQTYLEQRVPHDRAPFRGGRHFCHGDTTAAAGGRSPVPSCSSGPRASRSPAHVNALT
jgi:hypothetical protein